MLIHLMPHYNIMSKAVHQPNPSGTSQGRPSHIKEERLATFVSFITQAIIVAATCIPDL
jgi:hypothetical protein